MLEMTENELLGNTSNTNILTTRDVNPEAVSHRLKPTIHIVTKNESIYCR
jgi:hypothetical protein